MPIYGRTTLEPPPTWALPIIVDETTQRAIFSPIWLRWFLDFGAYVQALTATTAVSGGGTGVTSFTPYAPIFGGAISTDPLQSGTVGTTGQVLTSNGAGAIATFQDAGAASESVAFIVACSDETTALTTGLKVTFRMPFAMNVSSIRGGLTTAATGATLFAFDVKEGGTTIFSTKPTFDASSKTTVGAATPSVISDTALADNAEVTILVDAVGSTIAGAGLKVAFIGTKT
jgi:hypothetical protein